MAFVLVKHRVNDFEEWSRGFAGALEMRRAAGELSYRVLHASADPLLVVGLFEWDNLANARAFFRGADLKAAMAAAGVAEDPEVDYLEIALEGETRGATG